MLGVLLIALALLNACTVWVGAGAVATVVAIGAFTSRCYDYLDVTVLDVAGRKTCAATVTASNGSGSFELRSCYYAPLTDGHWVLRAALSGYPDATSLVDVEHANDCTRHLQTVELTLSARQPAAEPRPATAPNVSAPTLSKPAAPTSSAGY